MKVYDNMLFNQHLSFADVLYNFTFVTKQNSKYFPNFVSSRDKGKNENSCQNPSFLLFSLEIVLTYTHTMLLKYSNIKNKSSTETTNLIFSCPSI